MKWKKQKSGPAALTLKIFMVEQPFAVTWASVGFTSHDEEKYILSRQIHVYNAYAD